MKDSELGRVVLNKIAMLSNLKDEFVFQHYNDLKQMKRNVLQISSNHIFHFLRHS